MMVVSVALRTALLGAVLLLFMIASLSYLHTSSHASLNVKAMSFFTALAGFGGRQEAQRIYPQELIQRPWTRDAHTVPKIFHQSWKTDEVPETHKVWSETCRQKHPDWVWVLWTNEDNRLLVKTHFPKLLAVFDGLQKDIHRADLARNLYMYLYGGVYADLDVECLQSSQVIFDDYNVTSIPYTRIPREPIPNPNDDRVAFLGRMGRDNKFPHSIPNAWMASTPGHPFWLLPITFVTDRYEDDRQGEFVSMSVEALTGPRALRDMVSRYEKDFQGSRLGDLDKALADSALPDLRINGVAESHRLTVLPHQIIYPYPWGKEDADKRGVCWAKQKLFNVWKCKAMLHLKLQNSVAVTYWTHTW